MNPGNSRQYDEFVLRRLTEPIQVFGRDLPPWVTLFLLAALLLAGFFYIGWMYFRDSRGVGPFWATLLGLLRAGVYGVIAAVFLLPSKQHWEETSARSKVVVVFDTSLSFIATVDDIPPPGVAFDKMPTRQDKVLKFLLDPKVNFMANLEKQNPVTAYRIARGLDDEYFHFEDGHVWSRAERLKLLEDLRKPTFNPQEQLAGRPTIDEETWKVWLKPNVNPNAKTEVPGGLSGGLKELYEKQLAHNQKLAADGFYSGTNIGDGMLNVVTRELNNMVQGVVIFTDGRSTEGSLQTFAELEQRARAAHVPIFVVAVGEDRPLVRVEIADVRAPQQVQPEDKFRVVVEVTGEGLADTEFDTDLVVTYTRKLPDNKEEPLSLYLIEKEDPKSPKKEEERERLDLGPAVVLKPASKPKFDRSNPPRVEVEYAIDAAELAKAAGKDTDEKYKSKKWEIGETKDGEMKFRARVPKDANEIFAGKEHVSDPVDLRVVKRPVRVLMFASAATHDFQFFRNLMIREVDNHRAELSLYVQPPPGRSDADQRPNIVLGVKPPERQLTRFPDRLDVAAEKAEDKYYDLNEYDVIVAFDPDWTRLSDDQLKNVNKWADKGGGLVLFGGPINTIQLARPGTHREKLRPILDLLPVVLKDVRIESLERTTEQPWPLAFENSAQDLEFLKIAEDEGKDQGPPDFKKGWDEFFYGKPGEGKSTDARAVKRGFFNYYPAETVKTGAIVVARYTDPRSKMKDGTQMPYVVLSDPAGGKRVVWIAWGEMRRLRQYSEAFHERFCTKLARYGAAGNQTKLNKRINLDMNRIFTAGRFVQIDARIDKSVGEPYVARPDRLPTVELKFPPGVDKPDIPAKYVLQPRRTKDESDLGKYSVRFLVKTPGDYSLDLKVPETGDSVTQKFTVKESNPELDNTRPDFDQMYRMASEADAVLPRMNEAERAELKKRLQRPKLEKKDEKEAERPAPHDDKLRLYFDLKNAELIPSCMVRDSKISQNRGPYKDLWDDGTSFGLDRLPYVGWMIGQRFFNVMVLIIAFLSLEWLIRKLLRLA